MLSPLGVIRRHLGRDKEWYRLLHSLLGIEPGNIELYKLALLHRSASLHLESGMPINNERLEFLGDAILEAIVSDYVFIEYLDRDEGFMTQLRSKIVSRTSLNHLSREIGLADHVIHNDKHNGHANGQNNLYGDALEAMIGAMYLDLGYDRTNRVVINHILKRHLNLESVATEEIDFKSRLIEWCQKSRRSIAYHTAPSPDSPSGFPRFLAQVLIDGIEAGRGEGNSKKAAEQQASRIISTIILTDENSDKLLEIMDDIPMDGNEE